MAGCRTRQRRDCARAGVACAWWLATPPVAGAHSERVTVHAAPVVKYFPGAPEDELFSCRNSHLLDWVSDLSRRAGFVVALRVS